MFFVKLTAPKNFSLMSLLRQIVHELLADCMLQSCYEMSSLSRIQGHHQQPKHAKEIICKSSSYANLWTQINVDMSFVLLIFCKSFKWEVYGPFKDTYGIFCLYSHSRGQKGLPITTVLPSLPGSIDKWLFNYQLSFIQEKKIKP